MKMKDLVVGQEYSYYRHDYESSFPSRVIVLETGLHHDVFRGRSFRASKSARPDSVKVAHLNSSTGEYLKPAFGNEEVREEVVLPRFIHCTWEEQIERSAKAQELKVARQSAKEQLEERREQAIIAIRNAVPDHDLRHLPRSRRWDGQGVEDGSVVLSVGQLEAIVEALLERS